MPPGGFRTHSPNKQAAVDPYLRPHRLWDRQFILVHAVNTLMVINVFNL